MLGKTEGRRRRGDSEKVGWHHQLSGHEFEQALGDSEGRGSLACCSPWGHKELNKTYWLNKDNYLLCLTQRTVIGLELFPKQRKRMLS